MADTMLASANPEKRLFISLLTRDIPLTAAILDLIDNSVNAAVEPYASRLTTAEQYSSFLTNQKVTPRVSISISIKPLSIEVRDDAGGISSAVAADHVFRFGRGANDAHPGDRLSVYGIGLKRAMFKLGDKIQMTSDHKSGGFDLRLDVRKWEQLKKEPWTFEITKRPPSKTKTGTSITITDLHDDVKSRLSDGVFEGQLRDIIARTYAYYLARFVTIGLNGNDIAGLSLSVADNHASEHFALDAVSCWVTAGFGIPDRGGFRERSSGWFVLCNGRTVIAADKSYLTGWGVTLPIFQPKHRPFLGTVYFVSPNPELLPWTTTKSSINEDNKVWQLAKRHMASVGRSVISFLDQRYSEDGTEISAHDLREAAGSGSTLDVLASNATKQRSFVAPTRRLPESVKVQYDAKVKDVRRIGTYLKKRDMSASDVGRYTFQHFLKNEVGEG